MKRILRIKLLLLISALVAATQVARGDYLFTWEGNSSLFQGSFEVTDAEIQTNQFYYSLSLTSSISIRSPDGLTYLWNSAPPLGPDSFGVFSSSPIFRFYIGLSYPGQTPQGYPVVNANYDSIQEVVWPVGAGSPTTLYSETGLWNIAYIAEPSAAALLVLAAAAWLLKRNRLFRP